ncbi:hypothetical protein F2P79_010197 [Pimephales promelas]|nr:hypothetical protein F2P79_010197 [Pimephales promelas]
MSARSPSRCSCFSHSFLFLPDFLQSSHDSISVQSSVVTLSLSLCVCELRMCRRVLSLHLFGLPVTRWSNSDDLCPGVFMKPLLGRLLSEMDVPNHV